MNQQNFEYYQIRIHIISIESTEKVSTMHLSNRESGATEPTIIKLHLA